MGGAKALAERLGINEVLLAKLMEGCRELPDMLLLRVVDIVLASREPGLSAASSNRQDYGRGSDTASRRGPA